MCKLCVRFINFYSKIKYTSCCKYVKVPICKSAYFVCLKQIKRRWINSVNYLNILATN